MSRSTLRRRICQHSWPTDGATAHRPDWRSSQIDRLSEGAGGLEIAVVRADADLDRLGTARIQQHDRGRTPIRRRAIQVARQQNDSPVEQLSLEVCGSAWRFPPLRQTWPGWVDRWKRPWRSGEGPGVRRRLPWRDLWWQPGGRTQLIDFSPGHPQPLLRRQVRGVDWASVDSAIRARDANGGLKALTR